MKKKKKNDRGFTLIELLAVISILALVLSITMYSVTSIIRNAKEKTYLTTINEIEKAASNYITENSSELLFVSDDDNTTETQCVSVQDLIDYAFLDNNVINSNVTEDKKVNIGDYIYVERNKTTKTIEKNVYIYDEKTSINNICKATVIAGADINFEVNPKDWSRKKNVKIAYRVKTNSSFHDIKYGYKYISNSGNDIIPYSSDNVNLKNVTVSEKGTMYADILYEDNKTDSTKVIDKFDTSGPKISLYSDEKKYIRKKVTIPLSIKDCENSDNCSGLKEYTGDELANIISSEKLSVTIGNTKVDKSYLTLSNKESGIFNLVIDAGDTKYNGNVTITIKKDTFFDKTVDEPNGNTETTLESKIIFDNTIPNVENDSTKTYFVSEQTVTLKCSDDNGISGYYIGNTSPKTSDYTEVNNLKNYETTKKITSAGTYYLSCKDSAGNIETNEIKYYNYTLKYMLLTEDGTKGTYSLENYNGVSSNKYLLPENASIAITQINNKINSNIPTGSSSNNYVGYNKVKASSSISNTQTFNIVKKDNINQSDFNINDNLIYMFWFNRNLLNIKYQLADGETLAPGSYESDKYTWSVDDSYVKRTIISSNASTITFNSYRYRSGKTEINLYNNKTSGYFVIQKTGYLPKSGEEWKCTSGCKTNNMTFSQAKHEIDINNNVCDISKNDCDITLRANWTANTFVITLDNQDATTKGTQKVYSKYNNGIFLDSEYNNKMGTSSNPITLPTKTGYKFGGYYTETNGKGTLMINASGYRTSSFVSTNYPNSGTTLYAKWEANIFEIKLDSGSGVTSKGTEKVYSKYNNGIFLDSECNKKMTSDENNIVLPKKTGYTFMGYYSSDNIMMIDESGYKTKYFISTNYEKSGATLSAKWNANKVNIQYVVRKGESLSTTNKKYTLDNEYIDSNENTLILYNGNETIHSHNYNTIVDNNGTGLRNYNNSSSINIVKSGYIGISGKEWICINGCETSNKVFDHSKATYNANDFCLANNDDCTVQLAVNWTPIKYNLNYDLNNGSFGTSHPNKSTYDENFTIDYPSKTIEFVGHTNSTDGANGTGVTIGNKTTVTQTFNGWYISNSTKYENDVLIKRTSFENLTNVNNSTVKLTANWSSSTAILPKVTKSGYTCGWNTSSSGKTIMYPSNGQYSSDNISSNSSTTINLYAVCTKNTDVINGDRCYIIDNTIYHITTCDAPTYDDKGKLTDEAKCSYDKKAGKAATGSDIIRAKLRKASSCKMDVKYDCKTNGGSTENSTVEVSYDSTVNLNNKTCTKSGWTFVGWNTSKNANDKISNNYSSYKITEDITFYAIYKKVINYNYYDNGFGISIPSDTDGRTITCEKNGNSCTSSCDKCTSRCTLYNNQSKCGGITPAIDKAGKKYFSSQIDDEKFDDGTDLYNASTFSMNLGKNDSKYYVPNDKINDTRFWCASYDGVNRLQVFNISTCNGTKCTYTSLNGISTSSTTALKDDVSNPTSPFEVSINKMSTSIGSKCKAEYYMTVNSLKCYKSAKTDSGNVVTTITQNCKKISSFRTTRKATDGNWYYVSDKECYIDGSYLTSTRPSSCSSGGSSSSGNSYYVYLDANGGTFKTTLGNLPSGCSYIESSIYGSGEYKRIKCKYSSKFYLSKLDNTFSRAGNWYFVSWTYNGKVRSYVDSEENGSTLVANWRHGTSSGSSGSGGCFLAGTKVMTLDGTKDINKVKVGDMVLTYNEATKNNEYHKVTHLFAYNPNEINERLYTLKFDDKTTLKVSSTHRFYIRRNGEFNWIAAKNLKNGDVVMYANKKYHRIINIKNQKLKDTVYNISVDNTHNFYVGNQQVLVHNVYFNDVVGIK